MKNRDLIEFIPIGTLTIISLYSIFEVITTDYIFNGQQYIGLALLGVSLILFFTNRKTYKYIFGVTILLGLFNLIGFTTSFVTMNFLFIPIQLIVIPILLIFTWINQEQIKPKVQSILGTTEEQILSESNSKISSFRKRFEKLSNEEIEIRLNQKLMPEALEALKQIQQERIEIND